MAALQQVSEQEWEQHKDVLKGMYCGEKLPLLNRKGNGNEQGVVELMKERHGFSASPSQYELQFRKWGFTKNLKSGEWAALILQYDRLRETKRNVRITVSGSVLNKTKIDRARRRYRPHLNRTRGAMYKGGNLPASRQAHVEFLDESGEWTRDLGPQAPQVKKLTVLILRKSNHAAGETSIEDENRPKTPRLDIDQRLTHGEQPVDLALSSHDPFPAYRPFSPNINLDALINQSLSIDDSLFASFLPSLSNFNHLPELPTMTPAPYTDSNTPRDFSSEKCHQEIAVRGAASETKCHLEGARSLITSLVQRSRAALDYEMGTFAETEMPDAEEILESLESLLPDEEMPLHAYSGLMFSTMNSGASSDLFKILLYSFKNNFAGLRDVPRSSIMQLIKEHHDIRTQLFEVIKCGQPGVAKPLADNFFRAAVEGSDAVAVATIIQHTKFNAKIAINSNDVVCRFEDEDYTPIELAAKFRNTELVRTLLSARADPNKTYKPSHIRKWDKGPLDLRSASPPGEPEPVNIGLLKMLLDHGAEVRIDLVENAMRPGPGHTAVAEELMSRIPASEHRNCFKGRWLLISAIHYLESSAADAIVRRVFTHCSESEDCGKCVSENPRLIEMLLCHAARRANFDLTKFLVQHTAQLQSGLAAAIRACSDELVEFLLAKGARVDDPVESWRQLEHTEMCCPDLYDELGYDRPFLTNDHVHQEYVITPIRTPLAEAIRSRNHQLINTFERLGACARLSDKHHFHSAVFAAAEVGNTAYLKTVLQKASICNEGTNLMLALAVSIRNDETDIALILLDAGATLDPEGFDRRYGDPLITALERCNKHIVESMLECDVYARGRSRPNGKSALEAAAAWGDIGLMDDLMRLGGEINVGEKMTPLAAAVKTRNKNFVSQVLDLGASPGLTSRHSYEITPLRTAIEIGDYGMVRYLISKGATLADISAFLYAMSHDPVGYEILLSEFKKQHPHGLSGFGAELLAQVIETGSQPLMESLMRAGADVNTWCEMRAITPSKPIPKQRSLLLFRHRVLGLAIRDREARNHELMLQLLDGGADTNLIVYEYERISCSEVIWVRETPLLVAIKLQKLRAVRMLLEHGADLNRPARRGVKQTPLQAACEVGSYSIVEFLLEQGARVNDVAAERYGGTALQLAAKSGSLKIVRMLLDNGADPFMPKSKVGGRTAFEAAAESGCIDVLCQLWNAVLPLGFIEKECQSAKEFAKEKGHRGCVDFIDFLSGESSQSFLDI